MLGVKRGDVFLCPHEVAWETEAKNTIDSLKAILGDVAKGIEHVGSTSIPTIMAKPIIDIALAVKSFDEILAKTGELEAAGFYYRPNASDREQLLFSCGNYYDGTGSLQTHFIHVVLTGGEEWSNYIAFKNYLLKHEPVAKQYEALKISLAREFEGHREKYTPGKHGLITMILKKARMADCMGRTVRITVDRPKGTVHPKYKDLIYPLNYGYIPNTVSGDGEETDVYILGIDEPVCSFEGEVIAVIHRYNDSENKLVAAPKGMHFSVEEIRNAVLFQEQYFDFVVEVGDCEAAISHYDLLIDEGNDPVHDPKPLRDYMDKWDGEDFIRRMELGGEKTVLEIGVGTGRLAVRVARRCGEFWGIDFSNKTIERAKENLVGFENVRLVCGDFMTFDLNRAFDVVYSSLTFMHIQNKQWAIDKVAKLLNRGGRFVLSIDKNQSEFIDMGSRKIGIYPDSAEEIEACIVNAGLTLLEKYETEFATVFVAEKS